MHYAVIAAGEGSRLVKEGVTRPKPLVEVNGTPLVKRLIDIFTRCDAESVSIIINEHMPAVQQYLDTLQLPVPLNVVVKTTPSSMHSFSELAPSLQGSPFCLTTVDTIFREQEFARFIEDFRQSDADGMMAVTDYIDDEKPLYVGTDDELRITGFYDTPQPDSRYISGGIYCLRDSALEVLRHCIEQGQSRMRNFQRALVAEGLRLKARPLSKILDVDHAGDIRKAEEFLGGEK